MDAGVPRVRPSTCRAYPASPPSIPHAGPMTLCRPPMSSSAWAAAIPARSTRADVTKDGNYPAPPANPPYTKFHAAQQGNGHKVVSLRGGVRIGGAPVVPRITRGWAQDDVSVGGASLVEPFGDRLHGQFRHAGGVLSDRGQVDIGQARGGCMPALQSMIQKPANSREMTLGNSGLGDSIPEPRAQGGSRRTGARQLQRGARSTVSCPGQPADAGHETNRLP
jgi:hypothetical protein